MQTVPDSAGMIEAVAEWLEGPARAALSGAERYNARVAARALRGVERELRAGGFYFEPDRTALRAFVPLSDELDDEGLLNAMANSIRDGQLTTRTEKLVETLHEYTLRRLLLVNPSYPIEADRSDVTIRSTP